MTERQRYQGTPWMIVLEITNEEKAKFRNFSDLDDFRPSIRQEENGRLIADMSNEPIDLPAQCVEVLEKTQTIVREAGAEGSIYDRLFIWSCDAGRRLCVSDFLPLSNDRTPVSFDLNEFLAQWCGRQNWKAK